MVRAGIEMSKIQAARLVEDMRIEPPSINAWLGFSLGITGSIVLAVVVLILIIVFDKPELRLDVAVEAPFF